VAKCGSCHVLNRAETQGQVGPNLDLAFGQALRDGMGRDGVHGVVVKQIGYPARLDRDNPAYMPPKLVKGKMAENVAAYVASVVSRRGKDTGLLATAVKKAGGGKPAVAENGVLAIPADPTGQLAYVTGRATAEAGALDVQSKNDSSVPHNIALEGGGVDEVGEVVGQGGTSEISADVAAGDYTYFCTVPGHREGGMEGKLTVE